MNSLHQTGHVQFHITRTMILLFFLSRFMFSFSTMRDFFLQFHKTEEYPNIIDPLYLHFVTANDLWIIHGLRYKS